jgi:hypothetical protein
MGGKRTLFSKGHRRTKHREKYSASGGFIAGAAVLVELERPHLTIRSPKEVNLRVDSLSEETIWAFCEERDFRGALRRALPLSEQCAILLENAEREFVADAVLADVAC